MNQMKVIKRTKNLLDKYKQREVDPAGAGQEFEHFGDYLFRQDEGLLIRLSEGQRRN